MSRRSLTIRAMFWSWRLMTSWAWLTMSAVAAGSFRICRALLSAARGLRSSCQHGQELVLAPIGRREVFDARGQRLFHLLQTVHIDEHQHHAVNPVLEGPIRPEAQEVPAALRVSDLVLLP